MDESSPVSEVPNENPFVLASLVAEQVEIDIIVLAESETKRTPTLGENFEKISFKYETTSISYGKEEGSNRFYVVPSFSVKSVVGDEEDPDQSLVIKATFVVFYTLKTFSGIEDKHLQAYSFTNGLFNAWPYWREFVQNTTSRMGLTPMAVPVFRL
jgi:hypothetical protein